MNIILCNTCKGVGTIDRYTDDYHDSFKVPVHCDSCNGTGKQLTRSYTITVPFGTNEIFVNNINTKMFQLVQEINKEIENEK